MVRSVGYRALAFFQYVGAWAVPLPGHPRNSKGHSGDEIPRINKQILLPTGDITPFWPLLCTLTQGGWVRWIPCFDIFLTYGCSNRSTYWFLREFGGRPPKLALTKYIEISAPIKNDLAKMRCSASGLKFQPYLNQSPRRHFLRRTNQKYFFEN